MWRSPESSTTRRQPSRRSGTGSTSSVSEVDQQRVLGRAEQRGELVEQAGLRAHPVVLHARAQPRQSRSRRVPRRSRAPRRAGGELVEREAQRDLQRRRGGQPGALRHVAGDLELRRRAGEARPGELGDASAHEGAPAARGLDRRAPRTRRARRGRARAASMQRGRRPAPRRAGRRTVTPSAIAKGSARPVVVVGVLADQVDAAGREAPRCAQRGTGDRLAQLRGRLLGQRVGDERAGALLGAGEVLELLGGAQRRIELDVEVAVGVAGAGGRLVHRHHVGERALEERVVAARDALQRRGERAQLGGRALEQAAPVRAHRDVGFVGPARGVGDVGEHLGVSRAARAGRRRARARAARRARSRPRRASAASSSAGTGGRNG